jgi:hypothetical protein
MVGINGAGVDGAMTGVSVQGRNRLTVGISVDGCCGGQGPGSGESGGCGECV